MWTTFKEVPVGRVFHLHGFLNPADWVKVDGSWAQREGGQRLLSPSSETKVWLYPPPAPPKTRLVRFLDWFKS